MSPIAVGIALIILICVYMFDEKKYILVEKTVETADYGRSTITFLHFGKKVYKNVKNMIVDENHFYVPLKGNSLFVNRILIRKDYVYLRDHYVVYDYDGYEELEQSKIAKVFNKYKHLIER